MKKLFYSTVCAAAVLLSGCSDTELAHVGSNTQNAIGFHVVGNKMNSRANIIDSKNITSTDFNVYAYINNEDGTDGAPFMGGNDTGLGNKGINISHKGSDWAYTTSSDIRYWPTTDTELNFYAVNPGSNRLFSWQFSNTKKEIAYNCFNEYSVDNFYDDTDGTKKQHMTNPDAMYAVAKKQTFATSSGKVKFTFKHILSQVVFKAKTQYDNDMEVDINAVSIHNFKTGGTFTIPEGEPAQSNWTLNKINQASGFTVKKVEAGKNIKVSQSNNATDISDGPMLFVPQKLTKWNVATNTAAANKAEQSYLKITCKIKQSGAYLFGSATAYKDLYVPFEADWQPGKRYTYTLIFGGGYDENGTPILKPVNFETIGGDWTDETTGGDVAL